MVTKIASVYRVALQKHNHRQAKDGSKRKKQGQFKDVLAKVLMSKQL